MEPGSLYSELDVLYVLHHCNLVIFLFYSSIAVNCGELLDPSSGEVEFTSTLLGSVASYSCTSGYELMGGANRTCSTDGVWSGEEPACEGMLATSACVCSLLCTS